jgi:GT2 family glycosyltransferase
VDVTICVATFGDASWVELAERRALPSARSFGVPVVHVHGATLHDARNAALSEVETEWVVHLDADDELDAGYLDALGSGTADLRAPAVRYVRPTSAAAPYVPKVAGHRHACAAECLPDGNWLVVGSLVRAQMVRDVGGWRDFPWSEDWDLWLRCWLSGATVEAIPSAIYRAHVRADSRNRAPDRAAKLAAHRAIYEANFGVPA